jgi:hypothetical protein
MPENSGEERHKNVILPKHPENISSKCTKIRGVGLKKIVS